MAAESEFLQRILLSLAVGALIGLEREYTKKQWTVGLRSFALVSMLGTVSVLLSQSILFPVPEALVYLPYLGLISVIGYAFLIYYFGAKREFYGITTSLALPLAFLFGMLIGYGLIIQAIAGAVVTTILLYSRRYSHVFVQALTEEEIADALQFGIVLFILYPLLPDQPLVQGDLEIPLKKFVEILVLLSVISFAGFLAVRFYGQRVLPLTGFFGGLVSALAVTANMSQRSKTGADSWVLLATISAATIASRIGDLIILLYASLPLFLLLSPTFTIMILVLLLASLPFFRHKPHEDTKFELGRPFSVVSGAKFAVLFFVVLIGTQYVSQFGQGALLASSFIAGLVSISSVVAGISLQMSSGSISPDEAARAIIAATLAGTISNSAVLYLSASQELKQKAIPVLLVSIFVGIVGLALTVGL